MQARQVILILFIRFFLQRIIYASSSPYTLLVARDVLDMYYNLQHIYNNIYVEATIRNPLYRHKPGEVIDSPLFEKKLEEYIRSVH